MDIVWLAQMLARLEQIKERGEAFNELVLDIVDKYVALLSATSELVKAAEGNKILEDPDTFVEAWKQAREELIRSTRLIKSLRDRYER